MVVKKNYFKKKIANFNSLVDISRNVDFNPARDYPDYIKIRRKLGCGLREYYLYKIYDKNFSKEYRNNFLFWNNYSKFLGYLNPDTNGLIARNKFFTHIFLDKIKIPAAELFFLYDPDAMEISEHILNNKSEVYKWFTDNIEKLQEGLVCKPPALSRGKGISIFENVFKKGNEVILKSVTGEKKTLDYFLNEISIFRKMLFEKRIKQCSYLSELNPSTSNTLRIYTVLYPNKEVLVLMALFRVGRRGKVVDNLSDGENIGAAVDIDTGKIINPQIIKNLFNIYTIEKHPDSNINLLNFYIKDWNEIINKVKSFQRKIPFIKVIGWDIAITENGPVVVEMNDRGDLRGQVFGKKGWFSEINDCYKSWKRLE